MSVNIVWFPDFGHIVAGIFDENITFYIITKLYLALSMRIRLFECLSEGVGRSQYVFNIKHLKINSEGGHYLSKKLKKKNF